MAGLKRRLAVSSVLGEASSANDKIEVVRKQSQLVFKDFEEKVANGFANFYTLGREIGQGAHANAYVCHKKELDSPDSISDPSPGEISGGVEDLKVAESDSSDSEAGKKVKTYVVKVTRDDN